MLYLIQCCKLNEEIKAAELEKKIISHILTRLYGEINRSISVYKTYSVCNKGQEPDLLLLTGDGSKIGGIAEFFSSRIKNIKTEIWSIPESFEYFDKDNLGYLFDSSKLTLSHFGTALRARQTDLPCNINLFSESFGIWSSLKRFLRNSFYSKEKRVIDGLNNQEFINKSTALKEIKPEKQLGDFAKKCGLDQDKFVGEFPKYVLEAFEKDPQLLKDFIRDIKEINEGTSKEYKFEPTVSNVFTKRTPQEIVDEFEKWIKQQKGTAFFDADFFLSMKNKLIELIEGKKDEGNSGDVPSTTKRLGPEGWKKGLNAE